MANYGAMLPLREAVGRQQNITHTRICFLQDAGAGKLPSVPWVYADAAIPTEPPNRERNRRDELDRGAGEGNRGRRLVAKARSPSRGRLGRVV